MIFSHTHVSAYLSAYETPVSLFFFKQTVSRYSKTLLVSLRADIGIGQLTLTVHIELRLNFT